MNSSNTDIILECPVCLLHYADVDPTGFLCGHTCCLEDARKLRNCPICGKDLPKSEDMVVNITLRNIAKAMRQMKLNEAEVRKEDLDSCFAAEKSNTELKEAAVESINEDEDERETGNENDEDALVQGDSKQKGRRRKHKNKKKAANNSVQMSDDEIAHYYCLADFLGDEGSVARLEEAQSHSQLAAGFLSLLYAFGPQFRLIRGLKKEQPSPQLVSWLRDSNTRYSQYIVGYLESDSAALLTSAKAGFAPAMYRLALRYYKDKRDEDSLGWSLKAADMGMVLAQRFAAVLMLQENFRRTNEAIHYYRLAAGQGDPFSLFELGECYSKGIGVAQSKVEAFKYFKAAADLRFSRAMYRVGLGYRSGVGVAKDLQLAREYLKGAADMGFTAEVEKNFVLHQWF